MKNKFNFDDLFTLDLANNHLGSVEHGTNVIKELGSVVNNLKVKAAVKFQFRDTLDTFVHPDFKNRDDVKHIPWFIQTYMDKKGYQELIKVIRKNNMLVMSTPFDNVSVDLIDSLDVDIIKIASCSADDYPLIKRICQSNKPVIISTAGLNLTEIDKAVGMLREYNMDFAIMHCVALYPTPDGSLNLNQIDLLKKRYPGVTVGWSTHESPDDYITVQLAYAKGAKIFERHVGMQSDIKALNAYSSEPKHVKKWIEAYQAAVANCGSVNRPPYLEEERDSLLSLKRGVYCSKTIKKGDIISSEDIFYAIPLNLEKGFDAGKWRDGLVADKDYKKNDLLNKNILTKSELAESEIINNIMLQVRGMLNDARIKIGKHSDIEISHHYGLARFREFGAVIVDIINRQYCKKLIIQLPRQKHPYHFHKKKEETFQILYGDLEVEIDGQSSSLAQGDIATVEKNKWHKFHTLNGVIFEEISTTHFNDDSFYEDDGISSLKREDRKTIVKNWEC